MTREPKSFKKRTKLPKQKTKNKIKFINTCPHEIYEVNSKTLIPQSTIEVRLSKDTKPDVIMANYTLPMYVTSFGNLEIFDKENNKLIDSLPPEQDGVIYIVSALCMNDESLKGRSDIVAPGAVKKNKSTNKVIGCYGLRFPMKR